MTGSAHDSLAFLHTTAGAHPDYFFDEGEFAWADSAYTISKRMIPIHREPACFLPENKIFDHTVSHLRVRSEHCIGALKGWFQCLRGLRVDIKNAHDHVKAGQCQYSNTDSQPCNRGRGSWGNSSGKHNI